MSRIGKAPVAIPSGVTVEQPAGALTVKGPKGELSMTLRPEVSVSVEDGQVKVERQDDGRQARAFHGMTRALINNMVEGVTKGYEKTLEIHGVGWNAAVAGNKVDLSVGFCNTISVPIPDGVSVDLPNPTTIVVSGADKQAVGQLAARMRGVRPPEPYKGKGVRYRGEYVKQKAGKSFGS